jgi:hypothetical protein
MAATSVVTSSIAPSTSGIRNATVADLAVAAMMAVLKHSSVRQEGIRR